MFGEKYRGNPTLYDEVNTWDKENGKPEGSSMTDLKMTIDNFKKNVEDKIGHLYKTSGNLIELVGVPGGKHKGFAFNNWLRLSISQEFNLVSIYESHKSTTMAASMKRLSWVTVSYYFFQTRRF
jgi:hypothetical protein